MENKNSSQSLAVRYRPRVLKDLIGQPSVSTQILGMLKTGRFPSTILFAGESGGGKTTSARMLARYILCLRPEKDFSPCNVCISCKYSANHPDLHEINMADNRGIDDIRSMIQASKSMPTLGRKRIFLLDETHALTPQAFQTTLKVLEEPPEHTMWLLCTTNPEKIPSTILGRCHRFHIKPISEELIVKRLNRIASKEGVEFDKIKQGESVLKEIANLSGGRMRDSIAMLESVLFAIASEKEFSAKDLIKHFARNPDADLDVQAANFLAYMLLLDTKGCIKTIFTASNCRGLMQKTRWLIHASIQAAVGQNYWRTPTWKAFEEIAKKQELKVSLNRLLGIQDLLCTLEMQFNSLSIDEFVLMTSRVGNYIATLKSEQKDK